MNKWIGALLSVFLVTSLSTQALTDPTRPKLYSMSMGGESSYGFDLQSILLSKKRGLVLVNGQYYQERDTVGQNKIIKIREESVVILHNGEEKTVYLFDDVKRIVEK